MTGSFGSGRDPPYPPLDYPPQATPVEVGITQARTRGRGKKFVSPEILIGNRPAQIEDRAVPG